ncbi:hypothetical protein [Streptomyces sp. CBMA152]|uniref:hypothetical protein n=1 Tax=Streptomyces sp. CBMA152 TaxID=1896312 RepID=UPI001660F33C|nr:hypothetical protein [Streptomyces sp. CBMA152]MBD0743488.1 hypothetical protein [Streptomyces sp. CBMA152]
MPTAQNPPADTDEHDDFMKVAAAAKDIGCGERWLRDGINHGGFPHDRYGKSIWLSRQQRAEIRRMHRQTAQWRRPARRPRKPASTPARSAA